MRRLWPDPAPLGPEDLVDCYAPDRTRPWLRANFVASLDGAAAVDGYSRGLSSAADQLVLRLLRQHADAVMVGAGTLRHEGYGALRLDDDAQRWREAHGLAGQPTLVIVSNSLDLDPGHRMFAGAPVRPVVLTRRDAPAAEPLAAVADLVRCGDSSVDLEAGLAALTGRGLHQVLTEGGPHLLGSLLAADLVDEFCLTVSPLLAGAGATRVAAGPPMAQPARMRIGHLILAEENLLLSRYLRATS